MRFLILPVIFISFQLIHGIQGIEVVASNIDDLSCSVCKESADYVHEHPFETLSDVSAAMSQRCKRYNQYANVCQNTLDTFLPQIYQQAHDPLLTSSALCIRIGLCQNKQDSHIH
uniref:Saposin B-type domain-containing protein n=1 Tax=Panagrolaimus sp. ES5 TaxID=591445 RepID=A0AC34GUS6_9BILA